MRPRIPLVVYWPENQVKRAKYMRLVGIVPLLIATVVPSAAGGQNQCNNTEFIRPFPPSELRGAYEFSSDEQFHYAIPYAAAAVRCAAYATFRELGAAAQPITDCDCS